MDILEDIIEISGSSTYSENQFRIRTKRRRKRASIEANDKKLIRLFKEERKLRKQKHELPMIDLVPPIQKGFKRFFEFFFIKLNFYSNNLKYFVYETNSG